MLSAGQCTVSMTDVRRHLQIDPIRFPALHRNFRILSETWNLQVDGRSMITPSILMLRFCGQITLRLASNVAFPENAQIELLCESRCNVAVEAVIDTRT